TGAARFVACAVALALGACGGPAEDREAATTAAIVAEGTLGPVTATVTLDPPAPRFRDSVRVAITAAAAPGVELERLEIGARLGHLRVRSRTDTSRLDAGRLAVEVVAEPERTGTNIVRLPPIRFRVTAGEGA